MSSGGVVVVMMGTLMIVVMVGGDLLGVSSTLGGGDCRVFSSVSMSSG